MATLLAPAESRPSRAGRQIGWQGFTAHVPEDWDLTGFSGDDRSGYLRVDDSAEQALEIKWATEPKKVKTVPDVSVRRESYFRALRQTAKKKKIELETRDVDAPRCVAAPERTATGFVWTGDRKAIGAIWHCATCRRTVIAQVLGARSGRGGLSGVAESVLGSLRCHGEDPQWRTWALYDLETQIPADWKLAGQQLMNVYLRLEFAHKTTRLSVEQWALANVARKDAYLDVWLSSNSRGVLKEARYEAGEGQVHGHPTLDLTGGPALGTAMIQPLREVARFQRPATRFHCVAWQCEPENKIYAVQGMRPRNAPDRVAEVAERTRCHAGDAGDEKDTP